MAHGERHEAIAFEKVKHALPKEIRNEADMTPEIEAIQEMDASVSILFVVGPERRKNPELDS